MKRGDEGESLEVLKLFRSDDEAEPLILHPDDRYLIVPIRSLRRMKGDGWGSHQK